MLFGVSTMSSFRITPELAELGFKPFFLQIALDWEERAPATVARPARIVCERRGEYEVLGDGDVGRAKLSGRLEHELTSEQRPAVGDWALVEPARPVSRIVHVLTRQNVLRRRNVDGSSHGQSLAANVDVCFVVAALAPDEADKHTVRRGLNVRRLERYLAVARESRIPAVIVLNKADLASSPEDAAAEVAAVVRDADVVLVSALDGRGIERIRRRIEPGSTAVLLGSSGVGKSTLANRLLGRELQRTGEVREDDARGRHTTTEREVLALPGGGLLVDTPGMRELALWADADGDADASALGFTDIDALGAHCRFRDCTHRGEPGCAVLEAIEAGTLLAARLESARKLEGELRYQRARTDARFRSEEQRKFRVRSIAARTHQRRKNGDG
jgi:ribosome biogenesis GTPase / thiamine phosphate phosphatase